eukprot:gene58612-78194_t
MDLVSRTRPRQIARSAWVPWPLACQPISCNRTAGRSRRIERRPFSRGESDRRDRSLCCQLPSAESPVPGERSRAAQVGRNGAAFTTSTPTLATDSPRRDSIAATRCCRLAPDVEPGIVKLTGKRLAQHPETYPGSPGLGADALDQRRTNERLLEQASRFENSQQLMREEVARLQEVVGTLAAELKSEANSAGSTQSQLLDL